MFHTSAFDFTDDSTLVMTDPEGGISRQRKEELVRILEKIFCERCGQDLKLTVVFTEAKTSNVRVLREMQMQRELEEISRRARKA